MSNKIEKTVLIKYFHLNFLYAYLIENYNMSVKYTYSSLKYLL